MQQTECPFCGERVYCAEQLCNCQLTKRIPWRDTLRQHLPESRWNKKPRENTQQNHWGKKEHQYCPDLPQGPYSGKNPHPFKDHMGETWERFRQNYGYIGKKHFRADRKKYEKCYWDEILPEDLWEVTKRCDYDDEEFNYKYHGTWQEKDSSYRNSQLNQKDAYRMPRIEETIEMIKLQETELHQATEEPKIPEVKIQKTHKDAKLPFFATAGAAGCDLTTVEECIVPAYEQIMVDTGIAMAIPLGYCGQIKPRSSLALAGITIDAGVIDSDFRGSIMVIVVNRTPRQFLIEKHTRIAQMKFEQAIQPIWKEVKELPPTQRGTQGFGSTGRINVFKAEATNTEHEVFKDRHCYRMEPTLTKEQEKEVREMMKEFEDIIAIKHSDLPAETIIKHHIDTGTHYPLRQRAYRLPPAYEDWVREEIQQLLEANIIRKSNSPWASPIVMVPKKDKRPRMCVDYRRLNDITRKNAYPIPRMDEIIDMLQNASWYSGLDLWSGYNQIGMTEGATERSAFITKFGHYEYLRMSFGLCNAPATFQAAMDELFEDMIGHGVIVYIDDINVYAETLEEHNRLLREVMRRIRNANMRIKPSKCYIATRQISYLGFIIDKQKVKVDPEKIEAVVNYPRPKDRLGVRAFLGLTGFLRRFIRNYAELTAPLNMLCEKERIFRWGTAAEKSFQALKTKITNPPILIRPFFKRDFKLYTDASSFGLGAILAQDREDGEHVIAYASRGTRNAEPNYGATKLECLAVVWAVRKFRHYLIGKKFTLITDHSALKWLWNQPDPHGLFARWLMTMQEYEFETIHRKGKKHNNVDALSRIPAQRQPQLTEQNLVNPFTPITRWK